MSLYVYLAGAILLPPLVQATLFTRTEVYANCPTCSHQSLSDNSNPSSLSLIIPDSGGSTRAEASSNYGFLHASSSSNVFSYKVQSGSYSSPYTANPYASAVAAFIDQLYVDAASDGFLILTVSGSVSIFDYSSSYVSIDVGGQSWSLATTYNIPFGRSGVEVLTVPFTVGAPIALRGSASSGAGDPEPNSPCCGSSGDAWLSVLSIVVVDTFLNPIQEYRLSSDSGNPYGAFEEGTFVPEIPSFEMMFGAFAFLVLAGARSQLHFRQSNSISEWEGAYPIGSSRRW